MSYTDKTQWAEYFKSALNTSGFLKRFPFFSGKAYGGSVIQVPVVSTLATNTTFNGAAYTATAKNNTYATLTLSNLSV